MNNWDILWIHWDKKVVTVDVADVRDEDEWGKGGLMEE